MVMVERSGITIQTGPRAKVGSNAHAVLQQMSQVQRGEDNAWLLGVVCQRTEAHDGPCTPRECVLWRGPRTPSRHSYASLPSIECRRKPPLRARGGFFVEIETLVESLRLYDSCRGLTPRASDGTMLSSATAVTCFDSTTIRPKSHNWVSASSRHGPPWPRAGPLPVHGPRPSPHLEERFRFVQEGLSRH